jgi:hypothetical protein
MSQIFPCIFCKGDTLTSRAREHIVPASLGNEDHLLPQGMVCDKCNNYFGRKLEHPVLGSPYFQNLRARQHLTSRAGNPLLTESVVATGEAMFKTEYSPLERSVLFEPRSVDGHVHIEEVMARAKGGTLWIPQAGKEPDAKVLSRFFAKIGLEILAQRLWGGPDFATIIYDAQMDPVRIWARYGSGVPSWPIHRRRIYDEDRKFTDEKHPAGYQLLHEYELLITETNEWYAVICLFGEEFVINLGGPEIEGYEIWLKAHDSDSPLYSGRHAPLCPPQNLCGNTSRRKRSRSRI